VKFKLIRFFTGNGFASLMFATALMCLYTVGMMSRVVKEHFKEQTNKTHVRFAISRGFSPGYVLLRHAYKPVIRGLISVVISRLAWVIGGSAVLEFTFGIPGISFYLIDSMHANDYYVLQTYIMAVVVWMFLAHLTLGLALRLIDGQIHEK
jgi:peptide/nickel transport system permease protein